jgi:hypothetical protein
MPRTYGEPYVAAALKSIKDLERYRSHEDNAKRIAAAFDAVGVVAGVTATNRIIKGQQPGLTTHLGVKPK